MKLARCLLLIPLVGAALVTPPLVPRPVSAASLDGAPTYQDLQKQIEQLRQDLKTVEKQLIEMREVFQGRPSPEPALLENLAITVNGHPYKGEKDAKVVLVEFSDYECPFCANFLTETLPLLEREFISTGKIRYVRRDFPLVSMHPNGSRPPRPPIAPANNKNIGRCTAGYLQTKISLG